MKMEATCSSETSVDLNSLNGVISQKIKIFMTNAVRTSSSTEQYDDDNDDDSVYLI
jgi:hypothetical protein